MPSLYIKLYHRYVCIGKNVVYIRFDTTWSFRRPLGVLEQTPPPSDKGWSTVVKTMLSNYVSASARSKGMYAQILTEAPSGKREGQRGGRSRGKCSLTLYTSALLKL